MCCDRKVVLSSMALTVVLVICAVSIIENTTHHVMLFVVV